MSAFSRSRARRSRETHAPIKVLTPRKMRKEAACTRACGGQSTISTRCRKPTPPCTEQSPGQCAPWRRSGMPLNSNTVYVAVSSQLGAPDCDALTEGAGATPNCGPTYAILRNVLRACMRAVLEARAHAAISDSELAKRDQSDSLLGGSLRWRYCLEGSRYSRLRRVCIVSSVHAAPYALIGP